MKYNKVPGVRNGEENFNGVQFICSSLSGPYVRLFVSTFIIYTVFINFTFIPSSCAKWWKKIILQHIKKHLPGYDRTQYVLLSYTEWDERGMRGRVKIVKTVGSRCWQPVWNKNQKEVVLAKCKRNKLFSSLCKFYEWMKTFLV